MILTIFFIFVALTAVFWDSDHTYVMGTFLGSACLTGLVVFFGLVSLLAKAVQTSDIKEYEAEKNKIVTEMTALAKDVLDYNDIKIEVNEDNVMGVIAAFPDIFADKTGSAAKRYDEISYELRDLKREVGQYRWLINKVFLWGV